MVASRHLTQFGYRCTIVLPKPSNSPWFKSLIAQSKKFDVPILDSLPAIAESGSSSSSSDSKTSIAKPDLILDAIFGFSFDASKPIRAPFDSMIKFMATQSAPVVSVDVPSGAQV